MSDTNFTDTYILGNDYFTNENVYMGKVGEQIVVNAIKTMFKLEMATTFIIHHSEANTSIVVATGSIFA